ncbi:MAG: ankyrin repeat domain-containing protein, partial [Gammaproteobacteria bacterium]|nr:ankyrin repeat domain-containing protein [Gammaproteobacteria bacterium]
NKKGKGKRKSTKTNTTKPLEKFIIDVNKGEDKKKKHPSIWEAIDQANDDPQVLGELIKKHNILNFDELRNGETPLIYSIKQNHVKSAGSLIKHGANINLRDKNGKTPLMWSVMFNNIDTATSLIEHKADINLQDNEGYTALMFTNDLDITKLLIANGADVPLKNKKGQDALTTFKQDNEGYTSHCITNKDLDIAKLLIANGADVPLKIKNNNSLDNIGDYLLEQIGVAYRKTLKDILADPEMQFLKIPKDLENHQQILLEIVHTLLSRFESKAKMMEYFKHKKKQSDTDYQVPIKSVVLESKNAEEALAELLRSREFSKDDMGRERVLVAQFPNLTKEEYNILVHKAFNIFLPTNKTPVLRAIHLPDEKCIIAFIQPPIEKILDLHGFSVKQAQQNALEYIMDQYFDFADGASLMVGRGTHSKIKSGLSPITAKTKKLLEDLKKDNFVESYKQLPDRFNIRFYPPVAISKNELLDAINFGYEGIAMNSLNRIILKLDKKYQPNELIRKSCLLATDVLRLCPTVQKIYLFTKEDVESDFLKFLFTYNNLEDIPITMSEKTQYKVAVIGGGTTEESVCVSGI